MSNLTGLFLGAGASCDLAMPLVWELTDELRNLLLPAKLRSLNDSAKSQGLGFADDEIDTLVALLGTPNLHYEAVLGHLEVQFLRTTGQRYHGLYSWLVEIVYFLLYNRHIQNVGFIEKNIHLLEGISRLTKNNAPLWIFSLNHDLIIECLAVKYKIPLNCGFTKSTVKLPRRDANGSKIGELDAETIPVDELKRGMPFLNQGEPGINLLKIHGALDVFLFDDTKYVLRLLPKEETVSGVIESLRAANEDLIYVRGNPPSPARTYNEITYADDAGEMQFLRRTLLAGAFKFNNRLSQVLPDAFLSQFRTQINCVTTLLCIGYGFGDSHINQVIREWLERSADRQLEIIAPIKPKIGPVPPPFILHLPTQVTVTNSTASDYLARIL
jgi:hypothetical protein